MAGKHRAPRFLSLVLLVGPLVFPTAAAAQEFGVKGGLTLANVNVREPHQLPVELQWCCSPWDGTRHDMAVGLFAGRNIRRGVAVQAEVLFAQRGFNIGAGEDLPAARLRMSYVELPLLLQYVGGLVRIHAGPSVGFVTSSRQWSDDLSLSQVDISFVSGASVHRGRMSLDARYVHGLRNVLRNAPANASLRHKSFMLLLGVRLLGPGCACEVP